jgi:DNA-binding response OmpR family regulator
MIASAAIAARFLVKFTEDRMRRGARGKSPRQTTQPTLQSPISGLRAGARAASLEPVQLLLIEDDKTICRELALRWQRRGWTVRACETLAQAAAAAAASAADLIVLDLQLPDGDGLDWLERFRRRDRHTPVLALTARDRVSDRVDGLRRGADDYLVKPFAVDELDARVEALQRRAASAKGERVQCGSLVWLRDEGRALLDGQVLDLLPREFEVLGLLICRSPRLVPKRVIVDALAERNLEMGDSAVEVYVSRLRRKLAGSGIAIQTARGFGYRLLAGEAPGPTPPDP